MFWIIGGAHFVVALCVWLQLPDDLCQTIKTQFTHVKWEGFRFFDLIFPMFVFMSGITIPYSLLPQKTKGIPKTTLLIKASKRSLILIALGLSFTCFKGKAEFVRLYTVLWLIGCCYYLAALVSIYLDAVKVKIAIVLGILVSYHLLLLYLPFPGKTPELTPHGNLAAYLDRNLITTNLYRTVYDPEGTIRVFPAGALCLMGALVGQRIKSFSIASSRCAAELAIAGAACLLIGFLLSLSFPIIKNLWSSSFIFWAAGWSLLHLSIFYLIMDVYKWKFLGWAFIPIGMNSILIYVGQVYINFHHTKNFFFKGMAHHLSPESGKLLLALGLILIKWLLLLWLYKKRQFVKI